MEYVFTGLAIHNILIKTLTFSGYAEIVPLEAVAPTVSALKTGGRGVLSARNLRSCLPDHCDHQQKSDGDDPHHERFSSKVLLV